MVCDALNLRRAVLAVALAAAFLPYSHAGEISGTLSFVKKPPSVVLVYMADDTGADKGKKRKLDQKDQQFTKKMLVAPKGSKISFINSDNTDHNVYAADTDAGADFDIGLAPPGSTIDQEVNWAENAVIRVGCKIHPKMRAYVATVDSRYNQVLELDRTKQDHTFALEVPDTVTLVRVWLPNYEPVEFTLEKGGEHKVDLIKKGKVYGTLTVSRK
ncbi:hypothetical protein [Acanthopleuribacter pedis]|uniref:Uncharacterized protein n=1 Tax=Acanthopleuribacter pedis TaxID=442870 RepID=A0A8J7Q5W2_9BACT|nr:hypothetical protein [Acanthopleuribacter pedis]MBO1319635.1 hypothetical protein [Acanthopleuribacter pedis]